MPSFVRDLRSRYINLACIKSATFTTVDHHGRTVPAYRVALTDGGPETHIGEAAFERAVDTRAIVPAVEPGYTVWTFDHSDSEPFELGPVLAWRIDDDATAFPIHVFGGEFDDRDVVRAPDGTFYRPGDLVIGDMDALRAYVAEQRAEERSAAPAPGAA